MLNEIQEESSNAGQETLTKSKIETTKLTQVLDEKVFDGSLQKKNTLPKTRKMESF